MSKPLTTWYCDVCGEIIGSPQEGYVIWKTSDVPKSHSFKIIHQGKCDLKDHPASAALEDFLGDNGLTYLLSHLSAGPLIASRNGGGHRSVADIHEFVDLIRRLQIPYYEQARRKFSLAEVRNDFSDANEVYPYMPENLKRIAAKY